MSDKPYFKDPKKADRLFKFFIAYLALLLGAEFFIHKHSFFVWEDITFFHAIYGFGVFVVLILFAKHILRPIIKRREDYYD